MFTISIFNIQYLDKNLRCMYYFLREPHQAKGSEAMIQLRNVTKLFTTDELETTVLSSVNLDIGSGEFVAIMGPSGSGKSTLLNVIGLLDVTTDGELIFLDKQVNNLSDREKADIRKENIGFVFQSFNLIDTLTVYENVELPLTYRGMPATKRAELVDKVLKRMNIAHRKNHWPHQLSGGQQQRVAVARAVVGNPKLLLADEPTGNLDSKNGKEVMDLFKSLNAEGTTLVMVTHSETDAKNAKRIIRMTDGRVETSSPSHNAIAKESTPALEVVG